MAIRTNSDGSYTYPQTIMYPSTSTFPGQYIAQAPAVSTGAFVDYPNRSNLWTDPSGAGPYFGP